MLEMHLRNTTINSIPVIELYRERFKHQQRPVLFIFHGFDSSKERKLQHAYIAAAAGFFVILPDAIRHGEREDTAFAALSYEQKAEFLFDIVDETAAEINVLMDHYEQQSFLDKSRCGFIGTSMGGMLIYEYLARFGTGRTHASAVIISSPDFGSIIDNNHRNSEKPTIIPQSEIDRIKAKQPLEQIASLRDYPLLLINAEDDPIMPIQPVRNLYTDLHHEYSAKKAVRLHTYKNNGHQTTTEMMRESVEWMQRWLMEPNP